MQIVGVTDRGRMRQRNEDDLAVDPVQGLAVVADGMGGLQEGHVASREAVTAVMEYLGATAAPPDAGSMQAALEAANERVRGHAASVNAVMGTTAVVMAVHGDVCWLAHVGDSRAYLFRDCKLSQLTRDHSMVQEMVDRGLLSAEAARHSQSRNVITRAIGLDEGFEPDVQALSMRAGDLLLLCSDGLWDMLEDSRIAALLGDCGDGVQGLEACVKSLVGAANEAGGQDNITVVLARC